MSSADEGKVTGNPGEGETSEPVQGKSKRIAAGDLVFSVILILLGIYVMYEAVNMRVYRTILDAPGLFPFVLGAILTILGVFLFLSTLKQGAREQLREIVNASYVKMLVRRFSFQRVVVLTLLMAIYLFFLIGTLHFNIATFIYLVVTLVYLKATSLIRIALISAVVSVSVGYVFENFFRIPLP